MTGTADAAAEDAVRTAPRPHPAKQYPEPHHRRCRGELRGLILRLDDV
ncbi:hypothetical protein AB0F52_11520 [Amycolatopsis sp. NPDC024027]